MVNEYNLRDVTPQEMRCWPLPGCQAIYEVTPKDMKCVVGPCPGIHKTEDSYLIIGEQVNPEEIVLENGKSLAEKVGPGEVLIRVSKKLIDDKED